MTVQTLIQQYHHPGHMTKMAAMAIYEVLKTSIS